MSDDTTRAPSEAERHEQIVYWSVQAELVVSQGGTLTKDEAELVARTHLQDLIDTGRIFGAFIAGTRETDGAAVDPVHVVRR
jgi:hypothetical protein